MLPRWSQWVLLACGLVMLSACRQAAPPETQAEQTGPVVLIFELPDGEVRQEIADVAAGTTIAQLLQQVTDPPLTITGSGAMTFVSAVGDLGTSQGEGWTFTVDDVKADRGVGSFTLAPPATIRWTHTRFAEAVVTDAPSGSQQPSQEAASATAAP